MRIVYASGLVLTPEEEGILMKPLLDARQQNQILRAKFAESGHQDRGASLEFLRQYYENFTIAKMVRCNSKPYYLTGSILDKRTTTLQNKA